MLFFLTPQQRKQNLACLLQKDAALQTNTNGLPMFFGYNCINNCFKDGARSGSEVRGRTSHQSASTFATCYQIKDLFSTDVEQRDFSHSSVLCLVDKTF